jgi:4-hydroxythreonine-4-phosphate dehydrogenase
MSKKIFITLGDPAGINPYLIVETLKSLDLTKEEFVVIGDKKILSSIEGFWDIYREIEFIDLDNAGLVEPGIASKDSGRAAVEYLEKAVGMIKDNPGSCLVTGPLSKEFVALNRPGFTGHTEFLAREFNSKKFAMMMVGKDLKVVFLTRHIALREILGNLNLEDIKDTLILSVDALKRMFGIKMPTIALCSCNPHAGINTYLDSEEELLKKALTQLGAEKEQARFIGPLPSDTLFRKALTSGYDLVVVFYHDQGMIPFKSFNFSGGVNLTLGLGFIRTSPVHGPAFELVNDPGQIDISSMREAVNLASRLRG